MIRFVRTIGAMTALAVGLSGCLGARYNPDTGLYARTLGGAPATPNPTPYTRSLECLGQTMRERGLSGPVLAVGAITDLTGRNSLQTGRNITQGASLFAITALGKAGIPVVERYDRSISDAELAYAQSGTLGETTALPALTPAIGRAMVSNGLAEPDPDVLSGPGLSSSGLAPRPVSAGQIAGSQYYLVGGVTELNFNLRSSGIDAVGGETDDQGLKGNFRNQSYVMNVAIDLRLVDSVSQQVVAVSSYQKQMIGREIRAGVFDFLDGNVFDLSGGASQLEPLQLGVRTLVERGVFDLAARLYGVDRSACQPAGQASEDGLVTLMPLGPQPGQIARAASVPGAELTTVPFQVRSPQPVARPAPLPIQMSPPIPRPNPGAISQARSYTELDHSIPQPIPSGASLPFRNPLPSSGRTAGPVPAPVGPPRPHAGAQRTINPNSWRVHQSPVFQ